MKRAHALRKPNAPRAGNVAQSSKLVGVACASGPPPNGPERLPPYGDAAGEVDAAVTRTEVLQGSKDGRLIGYVDIERLSTCVAYLRERLR